MPRKMMRYVIPAGDTEIILSLRDPNYSHIMEYDRNIIIHVEEDEDAESELATLRFFETGEAVEGEYWGTLANGKSARHLYWVDAYEFKQKQHDALLGSVAEAYAALSESELEEVDNAGREYLRGEDTMPEVRNAGIGSPGDGAQGSSEEL